jgi:Txe/YoeB family toxin of Txe-Axe toxin-antitoxin module
MNVLFSNEGWEDYQYWQANDIKLLKKINDINLFYIQYNAITNDLLFYCIMDVIHYN